MKEKINVLLERRCKKMKREEIKKYVWIILLTIMLIVIDQVSKIVIEQNLVGQDIVIIDKVLKLTYMTNEGVAFSMGKTGLTSIVTDIIILAMVIRFMVIQKDKMYKITQVSLSLIISGGIGNLIDRIFRGKVIDFINLDLFIPKFPIFNLADVFIVAGFIVFATTVAINIFVLTKKSEN